MALTWLMRRSVVSSNLRLAIAILAVVGVIAGGLVHRAALERVNKEMAYTISSNSWYVSQVLVESLRLQLAIDGFIEGRLSDNQLVERFEILWSRVEILGDSEYGRFESLARGVERYRTELRATEPALLEPASVSAARLREIAGRFEAARSELHFEWVDRFAAQRFSNLIHELGRVRTHRTMVDLTLLAALIGLVGFLFWELHLARKARRQEAALREAADASARVKSEFLATMSHELRTPLNGVIGMSELLQRTELTERQRQFASIVNSSAKRLLDLINEILDFSRIESGKTSLRPAPFDLVDLALEPARMLDKMAYDKGVELVVRLDPALPRRVVGDLGRIQQVVANLLSNAVKFTEAGHVYLDVGPAEVTPGEAAGADELRIRISVRDTGIGIPEDVAAYVFDRFWQLDRSAIRKHQGTGLGLAICSALVGLMGGTISLRSEIDRGSEFVAEIPLQRANDAPAPRAPLSGNVLLVSAQALSGQVLAEYLRALGLDVYELERLPRAGGLLETTPPDRTQFDLILVREAGLDHDAINTLLTEWSAAATPAPIVFVSRAEDLDTSSEQHRSCVKLAEPVCPVMLETTLARLLAEDAGHAPAPAAGEQSAAISPAKPVAGRVLIVEDNDANRMIIQEIARALGIGTITAADGPEAVAAYVLHRPRLVLMDVSLPEMDGREATRRIRKFERKSGIAPARIVAITAYALEHDKELCRDAGMDGYLSKPFRTDDLQTLLLEEIGAGEDACDPGTSTSPRSGINGPRLVHSNDAPLRAG